LEEGKADIEVTVDELVAMLPPYTGYGRYTDDDNTVRDLARRYIAVSANVTEAATGTTLSGNNAVVCTDQKYNLTFLDITPSSFKPGLNVSAYVRTHLYIGYQHPLPISSLYGYCELILI